MQIFLLSLKELVEFFSQRRLFMGIEILFDIVVTSTISTAEVFP